MDEKKAALMEDMDALKRELDALKGALKDKPQTAAETAETPDITHMRRVLGDYIPGPKSPTYRALMDAVEQLQKEKAQQAEAMRALQAELDELKRTITKRDKEIFALRNPAPVKKTEPVFAEMPETEKEKADLFFSLVFSSSFSDGQVAFLTGLVMIEDRLSADDLLSLADPRLSPGKMSNLYAMICRRQGLEPRAVTMSQLYLDGTDADGTADVMLSDTTDNKAADGGQELTKTQKEGKKR